MVVYNIKVNNALSLLQAVREYCNKVWSYDHLCMSQAHPFMSYIKFYCSIMNLHYPNITLSTQDFSDWKPMH